MENNLQHEDLLIKLRAKLKDEKIKLWEPPYLLPNETVSKNLQDLALKYATELSCDQQQVKDALRELQLHSLERSKANAGFLETGYATFRVRATVPGEQPQMIAVKMKLDVLGSDIVTAVADIIKVPESRIKLIFNGKVIKPTPTLEQQGLKNGTQIMALIMSESPEEVKEEHSMYMEMKQTRDDATLLAECADVLADDDDDYMKLEDQSGNAIQLPAAEKRSLLVGLALHEHGRAHIKKQQYAQALILLLEADNQLIECRSSILQSVDNYAVLQVDIVWCYVCLKYLHCATDAERRLKIAENKLSASYGERSERLKALKGTDANERVIFMRLFLLQGIVAYYQNKREEAAKLLHRAQLEIDSLRVDETSVAALMELGWSMAAARAGLRATLGDVQAAHHYLADRKETRQRHRAKYEQERDGRVLGLCADGTPVNKQLVQALVDMGYCRDPIPYSRRLAAAALRNANNTVAEAVRIIQEQRHLLEEDMSSDESSPSSEDSLVEPDSNLVAELVAMGYAVEDSRSALSRSRNDISGAVHLLVTGENLSQAPDEENPSTSGASRRKSVKRSNDKRRKECQAALSRLRAVIRGEEDDYLDSSLHEEEELLRGFKPFLEK